MCYICVFVTRCVVCVCCVCLCVVGVCDVDILCWLTITKNGAANCYFVCMCYDKCKCYLVYVCCIICNVLCL